MSFGSGLIRPLETCFWEKVDKNGPVPAHRPELGQCWVWTACKKDTGYGQLRHDKKLYLAPRLSYEMQHGKIADGLHVLHQCDTPACVRPDHLFLGTNRDNIRDRMSKGRTRPACGKLNGRHTCPENSARGERSGSAKMTEARVSVIREEYAGGSLCSEIARLFGVHYSTIECIIKRKTWKHVV